MTGAQLTVRRFQCKTAKRIVHKKRGGNILYVRLFEKEKNVSSVACYILCILKNPIFSGLIFVSLFSTG